MTRRLLLVATTALALIAAPQPAKADLSLGDLTDGLTEVFGDAIEGIMAALMIIILAEEQTASVPHAPERLLPTEIVIGRAPRSYVVPGGMRAALPELYPEEFETYSPLEGMDYSTLRNLDRQERTGEAMDLTAEVMARRAEVTATLTRLQLMNRQPAEALGVLGAQQVGNEAALAMAASVEELTRVTAEAAQLEADQRLTEQYNHYAHNLWKREHYPDGWFTGTRTFAPDYFRPGR